MAYVSHGVFSGEAFNRIEKSAFESIFTTDSIPLSEDAPDKIKVISCAPLLAKAIMNIHTETSISCLFE